MNTLKAEKRDMSIKAKKLRREGFVTGNLFGRELEDSIPLKFDKAEIEKLLKVECLGTFLRLRRSLATPTLYAAVRILSGAFVVY